ncbi:MAG TPA: DUF6580 family putative transport protein [Bacteroidota bacterium]
MRYTILAVLMILAAAFSRLLPHPANVAPFAAMALAGGVYLDKRFALLVPLAAMFVTDLILGFYTVSFFVYGSFVAIGFLGLWLKSHKKALPVFGATVTSSILFFVVTNFGVWAVGPELYPRSWAGLVECYVAAIPFFRNTVFGDMAYVAVLFGMFELLSYYARNAAKVQKQSA